jgi:hypothetical protein
MKFQLLADAIKAETAQAAGSGDGHGQAAEGSPHEGTSLSAEKPDPVVAALLDHFPAGRLWRALEAALRTGLSNLASPFDETRITRAGTVMIGSLSDATSALAEAFALAAITRPAQTAGTRPSRGSALADGPMLKTTLDQVPATRPAVAGTLRSSRGHRPPARHGAEGPAHHHRSGSAGRARRGNPEQPDPGVRSKRRKVRAAIRLPRRGYRGHAARLGRKRHGRHASRRDWRTERLPLRVCPAEQLHRRRRPGRRRPMARHQSGPGRPPARPRRRNERHRGSRNHGSRRCREGKGSDHAGPRERSPGEPRPAPGRRSPSRGHHPRHPYDLKKDIGVTDTAPRLQVGEGRPPEYETLYESLGVVGNGPARNVAGLIDDTPVIQTRAITKHLVILDAARLRWLTPRASANEEQGDPGLVLLTLVAATATGSGVTNETLKVRLRAWLSADVSSTDRSAARVLTWAVWS